MKLQKNVTDIYIMLQQITAEGTVSRTQVLKWVVSFQDGKKKENERSRSLTTPKRDPHTEKVLKLCVTINSLLSKQMYCWR
jgi:hypothetical protein